MMPTQEIRPPRPNLTDAGNANQREQDIAIIDDIDMTDERAVWERALSLASTGNIDEASRYFQVHAQLKAKGKAMVRHSTLNDTTDIQQDQPPNVLNEGGLSFIPGAITSHMDIGFTPYFDKNLRELKGPIPLTIFNKHWQELANSYHVEKRVKIDNINKDTTTYTGYPYPHEMTQTYAVWNVNYRNFVTALRDVYKFKTFAKWAEIHQSNVEFYHERDNWMTAFRYDIKIRGNAFAFRVSENGTSAPPDISQRREDIATICFAETRRLDEGAFTDNPYAKGGVRFGFDWTTGQPRNNSYNHMNSSSSNNNNQSDNYNSNQHNSHHSRDTNNNYHARNRKTNESNKTDPNGSGSRPRGGYNGKNFDPNYAAKKAAAAAKATQSTQGGGNA